MSDSHDRGCRCGDGPGPLSAAAVEGAPGLSALVHENRAHGWPNVMLRGALTGWSRSRGVDPADVGISLVKLLAHVADHVAYAQDRVATEAYLGTAGQRTSVRRLARLLEYELHPGLGISAEVAFALETRDREPSVVEVPGRVLVRSADPNGEASIVFSTAEALEVHAEWNLLRPRYAAATDEPLERNGIALDRRLEELRSGRLVLVEGIDAITGANVAEVATLDAVSDSAGVTVLALSSDLEHSYRRVSVKIHGNVVRATRGDTTVEVLGSGDASVPWQLFPLAHPALDRALDVRVDGVRWTRVETLRDAGPHDRAYVVVNVAEGGAAILFGDGANGARPRTGTDNVTARYRVGSGATGNVGLGRIASLSNRPVGLERVTNPVPASGGVDVEQRDEARENAPKKVGDFERLVSLRDYEDVALGFPGIGKATSSNLWNGSSPVVHITVAASDGASPTDEVLEGAYDATRAVADPVRRLVVESYAPLRFTVRATVGVDRRHTPADVRSAVLARLAEAYSFARVGFGQVVESREVADVLRQVAGVTRVEAVALRELGGPPRDLVWLAPRPASIVAGRSLPAQLAVFDAGAAEISLSA